MASVWPQDGFRLQDDLKSIKLAFIVLRALREHS